LNACTKVHFEIVKPSETVSSLPVHHTRALLSPSTVTFRSIFYLKLVCKTIFGDIFFLLNFISCWNLHDMCQRFSCN